MHVMKVIFIGRDNPFNRGIARWLSKRYDTVACYFIEPDRFTFRSRFKRIRNRARRRGWIRALDELAFHLVDRIFVRRKEGHRWESEIPEEFRVEHEVDIPSYIVPDVHDPKWLEITRNLRPDIIFCVCGTVILKREFYSIPRYGTFVLHEGITPEYRGLHTPLWALLRNEPEFLGYTLLRVNDSIDGGDILVQGGYDLTKEADFKQWSFVGHNGIIRGLPEIGSALDSLAERGTFDPVSQTGRKSNLFTWIRLSTFLLLALKSVIHLGIEW